MINGKTINRAELKKDLAHVSQDDSLNGNLTVYENIWYSDLYDSFLTPRYASRFLLPNWMTTKEKDDRVAEVIQELGLNKAKHTKIGTWLYRGVSGGERRRCSIALAVCFVIDFYCSTCSS
jgi:ABC-type multidrug transport system ATPase subunit